MGTILVQTTTCIAFPPRTVRDWNELLETVVQAFNVDSFKMSVLHHFSN